LFSLGLFWLGWLLVFCSAMFVYCLFFLVVSLSDVVCWLSFLFGFLFGWLVGRLAGWLVCFYLIPVTSYLPVLFFAYLSVVASC